VYCGEVLQFLKQLDGYSIQYLGTWLWDLDNFDKLRSKLSHANIDTSRHVSTMSEGDVGYLLDCLHISKDGDLALLHYRSDIEDATFEAYDGILKECRGIIVDLHLCNIVSLPFPKFKVRHDSFEFGGELVQATYYRGRLVLATEYKLNGDVLQDVRACWSTLVGYDELADEKLGHTVLFKWVPSKKQKAMSYPDNSLYLIGLRCNSTGKLLSYERLSCLADWYEIPGVQVYEADSNS